MLLQGKADKKAIEEKADVSMLEAIKDFFKVVVIITCIDCDGDDVQ